MFIVFGMNFFLSKRTKFNLCWCFQIDLVICIEKAFSDVSEKSWHSMSKLAKTKAQRWYEEKMTRRGCSYQEMKSQTRGHRKTPITLLPILKLLNQSENRKLWNGIFKSIKERFIFDKSLPNPDLEAVLLGFEILVFSYNWLTDWPFSKIPKNYLWSSLPPTARVLLINLLLSAMQLVIMGSSH